ncbi:LolA family protein [Thermodesulforhabdus norvegica]|nr:outer membrane lipoprotein carrier protein LolA [Thermodesulforhabdus norvegica]
MKKPRWLAAFCLLCAFLSGFAGLGCAGTSQDPQSPRAVISQIQNRYRSIGSFDARFIQESFSPGRLSPDVVGRGIFVYRGTCRMAWKYDSPEEQVFVILPQVAWLFSAKERQIQLFGSESLKNSVLDKLLSDNIEEAFSVEPHSIPRKDSENLLPIVLIPKSEASNIKQVTVTVNITTGQIHRVDVLDLVGRRNIIIFFDEKIPGGTELDELFEIPEDPEITVIDERGVLMSPDQLRLRVEKNTGKEQCGR